MKHVQSAYPELLVYDSEVSFNLEPIRRASTRLHHVRDGLFSRAPIFWTNLWRIDQLSPSVRQNSCPSHFLLSAAPRGLVLLL